MNDIESQTVLPLLDTSNPRSSIAPLQIQGANQTSHPTTCTHHRAQRVRLSVYPDQGVEEEEEGDVIITTDLLGTVAQPPRSCHHSLFTLVTKEQQVSTGATDEKATGRSDTVSDDRRKPHQPESMDSWPLHPHDHESQQDENSWPCAAPVDKPYQSMDSWPPTEWHRARRERTVQSLDEASHAGLTFTVDPSWTLTLPLHTRAIISVPMVVDLEILAVTASTRPAPFQAGPNRASKLQHGSSRSPLRRFQHPHDNIKRTLREQ